jgi:hypothetical protein
MRVTPSGTALGDMTPTLVTPLCTVDNTCTVMLSMEDKRNYTKEFQVPRI